MTRLKHVAAAMGVLIILGNLMVFFIPPFRDWLERSHPPHIFAIEFLILFFVWGGGLTGIFLPLFSVDCESPKEKVTAMWLRLAAAVSTGGFLAWCCMAAIENVWDFNKGPSIVTLQFFTTWSFAAAICLVQEALPPPKLSRTKAVFAQN